VRLEIERLENAGKGGFSEVARTYYSDCNSLPAMMTSRRDLEFQNSVS